MRLDTADVPIAVAELRDGAAKEFGNWARAVVDPRNRGAKGECELLADQEPLRFKKGKLAIRITELPISF